jgi:serine/threonine protein kinase
MDAPHISCSRQTIEQFLADQLGDDERLAFEVHLESCASCRNCLDNLAAAGSWWEEARGYLTPGLTPGSDSGGPGRPRVLAEASEEVPSSLYGLRNFLAPTDDPRMLGRLGGYEIAGVVGCGGNGVVLKAFDTALNRYVAIKVLAPHLAPSAAARQRFAREAKAAAAVMHDNVMAIHAVAEAHGLPYIVMPYVRGPSLEKRLRQTGAFAVVEVLRIGMQIASGLAAAHAQGLVHRDIKPANILLEEGIERVTLTDFGLARAVDDASLTTSGVVPGTPQYMSPEQASGRTVDHRSDLFSLGSVLYTLCTGRPPFRASTTLAVLRHVEEETPIPIREINPEVPEWLADIIARLHAKAPGDRFRSASEVAVLLESGLAHLQQPATVPPPCVETERPRDEETERYGDGRRLLRLTLSVSFVLLVSSLLAGLAVQWLLPATTAPRGPRTVAIHVPMPGKPLEADESTTLLRRLRGHVGPVHNVLFTPDGRLVSVSGWPEGDRTLRLWDPANEAEPELTRVTLPNQAHSLALSPDGRFALVGLDNGTILYLGLDDGKLIRPLLGHAWVASSVGFAPDGLHAISSSLDGTARMWDLRDGKEVRRFTCQPKWVRSASLSPDGRRLLTAGNSEVLQLWDVATGKEIKRFEPGRGWINYVAFTPDGRHALVGDREAALHDVETGEVVRVFEGHRHDVYAVVPSPDGRRLLTASWDGGVRLWDFQTGKLLRLLGTHDGFVFGVAFAPDGRTAASCGGGYRDGDEFLPGTDYDIRLWDLTAVPDES